MEVRPAYNACLSAGHARSGAHPRGAAAPPTNATRVSQGLAVFWRAAGNTGLTGYSLPESDAFFRYLFALGTIGESPLRRVWVFNPDDSPELQGGFRALFGPGAEQRFEFLPKNFDQAIFHPHEEFQNTFDR